ncbi:hypothetical protein [Ralstonia phage RP31]|uniref:Uncharacterized protein n=2 Tax=Ripduovirus RP12 TaxID=2560700 RepID=A0A1L7N0R0_9CAUD|nr:hypothetical protein FDH28_gp078 [Ralstonia phage RP12]BAW19052.1 hypothetical protein [Ralstonia phage RP12]BAW19337.1 hypothetical protein [Ralstonia phage RP31]
MSRAITIENPKEHFIRYDGLLNVQYDVTFSIFKKYTCQAGCKICYIKDDFLPNEQFKKYVPIASHVNTQSYGDRLLEFLSYFQMAAIIDDLYFVREEHPELYKFYQEYSEAFWLSSMTDNAVFRHLPIIEDDLRVVGLREISLSEEFLYKVNQTKFFNALDKIQRRAKILKIKVILSGLPGIAIRGNDLMLWCQNNQVLLEKQYEHGVEPNGRSFLSQLPNTRYSDRSQETHFTEEITYSENSGEMLYPIHSESIFLQYDDFYSELKSATREDRSAPFAKLDDFVQSPQGFLAKVLEGKLTDYRKYASWMQNKDHDYFRYFDYVANNVVVNHDFNFIPRIALRPDSVYYHKLMEHTKLVDTQYGLVDSAASKVVPIYSFREQ